MKKYISLEFGFFTANAVERACAGAFMREGIERVSIMQRYVWFAVSERQ